MRVGRPQRADPGTLYAFAHQFYWDFRRLAEGKYRWRFHETRYRELTEDLENTPVIDDEDRARYQKMVDDEIRAGLLEPSQRAERLRYIEESETWARRESYRQDAAEEAAYKVKVPGETDVIRVLLDPSTTPERVRELCKDAFMTRMLNGREVEVSAWPISAGSTLPTYLSQYAEQYVVALHDSRFPRCDVSSRPSTRLKQFWFLSRALAGALFEVKTRTAINLVGSLRPEEIFQDSRDAKPQRKRRSIAKRKK